MHRLLFLFLLTAPAYGVEPPGLAIAGSDPQAAATPGSVSVAAGRFVPLSVAGGKPALVLGNDAGLLEMLPLPAGHTIIGIRFDEPAGAKPKSYKFPGGAVTIAIAGEKGGTVTLTSVVNGATATDAPSVAGKLVLTLTAPIPPPPIPPGPIPPGPVPPGPTPPPQPVTSFRVIFVRESGKNLTAQQQAIPTAAVIDKYLRAKTTADGTVPGFREYDPQTNASNDYPAFQKLWAAAQAECQKSHPCVVIQVNEKVEIVPWPANTVDALKLLKQYGGDL